MKEILQDFNRMDVWEDPNRPGPNYYDGCKKFDWVDALTKKHKQSVGEEFYQLSDENKKLID